MYFLLRKREILQRVSTPTPSRPITQRNQSFTATWMTQPIRNQMVPSDINITRGDESVKNVKMQGLKRKQGRLRDLFESPI